MGDQVSDILKKVTQQNDEFSKKFSQFEQKMNARDSGASNLGTIGIEGQRMTGNVILMEDCKTKMYVPEWFETEKPALIDLPGSFEDDSETGSYGKYSDMVQSPRRGIHSSETFLTGMEYLSVAQYMCLTHITISVWNFADNHKSGTVALILIFMSAAFSPVVVWCTIGSSLTQTCHEPSFMMLIC